MSKSFKVVHIIVGLGVGGAETQLRRLIQVNLFSRNNYKHIVISLTELGVHGEALRAQGVEVHALGLRGPLALLLGFFRLMALLRHIQPCIVQTWMVHSDLLGGLAARIVGVRHVIWGVRTTDYSVESRSTRLVRWLCARLSSRIPDKIVCAAQAALLASNQARYDTRKLMVIPNGFDVVGLRARRGSGAVIRQQCGFDASHVVVGCLGRYNPAKDHANFVRAAGLLVARFAKCRFLMVGRDVHCSNAVLMAQIQATGFADRFVLLGERADPESCLDAMDVFALSSCTEGFPNVLGEAMAMGVPCVCTNVGDAAVLLGDAGPVVPARNAEALAEAMAHWVQMPQSVRQALGRKGQERVQSQFTMDAAARRFNDLYKELMAKA
jgi:glycosyltransferase involved in cell wall biosynthesis